MNAITIGIFLALIAAYAGSALWRVNVARRSVPARAETTGPEAVGASAADVPVSRLGLYIGILAVLTLFVFQWLFVALPGWALFIWVPAALTVVVAAWEAARIGPHLPWLRPAHRRADIISAVGEGVFTLLIIGAAAATIMLALR